MRYLVRCAHCDRAFWLDRRDAPVPDHSRWERRTGAHRGMESRCGGSLRQGDWIAESDGPPAMDLLAGQ